MELHVVLHDNCPDGTCSGWVVGEWMRRVGISMKPGAPLTEVYWLNYDSQLPKPGSARDRLWMIDYSRRPQEILEAGWALSSVMILDHHQSAVEDWQSASGVMSGPWRDLDPRSTLDVTKSGAGIAWDVLMPKEMRPMLVNYIEDRDLWRFALPYSREVAAWIRSYPLNDAGIYGRLARELDGDLEGVMAQGEAIGRANAQHVAWMADRAVFMMIGGHLVPVVNATTLFSEVGEELCLRHPEAPFAAYYFDRADGIRQWGARARGSFDLVPVARAYGGGGARGAGGWTSSVGPVGPGGRG